MSDKAKLLSEFELFRGNGGGIEAWFSDDMPDFVVDVLLNCEKNHISCEVLNQLLILSHEGGVSRSFFDHYFCSDSHKSGRSWYDPKKLPEFDERFLEANEIIDLSQLKWGLSRLYIDALLYFGNIRQAFRTLRSEHTLFLEQHVSRNLCRPEEMENRGPSLPLEQIAKDDRYLIAEIACKTYEPRESTATALLDFMKERHKQLTSTGRKKLTVRELISSGLAPEKFTREQLSFSLDEIMDTEISKEDDLEPAINPLLLKFQSARQRALRNTSLYLSMVADLDVYVATSMRSREDFRAMGDFCDHVFQDRKLQELKLRYFDPTLSAAIGHEDKGLIECLMVKCAKVLVYNAGLRDSYGKDAEAAMALSLGKPVIFFCDNATRQGFYRDVHPLSRLINFETGVAVGAIVTDNPLHVIELLSRIFRNEMVLELNKKSNNYFLLCEKLTNSTIRLQTDDMLLRETFWNYYSRKN